MAAAGLEGSRRHPLPLSLSLTLSSLLALFASGVSCSFTPQPTSGAFQAQPFSGQGGFPDSPRDIYVSPMLERLVDVDDREYRFETVVYLYLSWQDPWAAYRMYESTLAYRNGSKEVCEFPCASGWKLARGDNQGIFAPETTCCDDVWLPTIDLMNVYELPDTRLQPYQILTYENGAVAWWTAVHGKYYTPMDITRFPFDTQELVMQFGFQSKQVVNEFIPSSSSTRFLIRGQGEIVSGWDVKSVEVKPWSTTMQEGVNYYVERFGTPSNPNDPAPIVDYAAPDEGNENGYEIVSFDVVVTISRKWRYYVLNMIVPILLLVCLSLVTYMIPADSLDTRISLNVTLFLSLTALQFIINAELPKSSNPSAVTELILASYIMVAFAVSDIFSLRLPRRDPIFLFNALPTRLTRLPCHSSIR